MTATRRIAVITGLSLLAMAIIAPIAVFGVIGEVRVSGDATATAAAILESAGAYRAAVAALVLVAILDVVIAWGLYVLFIPAGTELSRLAAWFRLAYVAVFLPAIANLLLALLAAESDPARTLFYLRAYDLTWQAGLAVFGVHLLLLGVLAWRSGFVYRVLAALLVLAGAGYIFDGFAALLLATPSITLATFTFVGEVLFILWLLIRGGHTPD